MKYSIDQVLDFITGHQEPDGSFPTYELYPVAKSGEGWARLQDPSPFITASVLVSLLHANDGRVKRSVERAKPFFLSQMEWDGYWRFWPVKSGQHPVPYDVDVTALCSYVLGQAGVSINNRNFLKRNRDRNGKLYTWIIPTIGNLIRAPVLSFRILKSCVEAMPTHSLKYFDYTDQEPAVAANLLLYLGEDSMTMPGIRQVIAEVDKGDFVMDYYHDEWSTYYHISRAYASGVKSFDCLREIIVARVMKRLNYQPFPNELLCAMAANILLDFGLEMDMTEKLLDAVAGGQMYPDQWQPMPYFSSKDRNFFAGSPQFTAAVFIEAVIKWGNRK